MQNRELMERARQRPPYPRIFGRQEAAGFGGARAFDLETPRRGIERPGNPQECCQKIYQKIMESGVPTYPISWAVSSSSVCLGSIHTGLDIKRRPANASCQIPKFDSNRIRVDNHPALMWPSENRQGLPKVQKWTLGLKQQIRKGRHLSLTER